MGAWTELLQGKFFLWVRGPYAVLILLVRVVCGRLLVHQHSTSKVLILKRGGHELQEEEEKNLLLLVLSLVSLNQTVV